eukprot:UC1_evm1s1691
MEILADATRNVQNLSLHQLKDDTPSTEAVGVTLNYVSNFDTNFEDRAGFIGGIAKYVEEAQSIGKLNNILDEGFKYAAMIYTWRSMARAIPQASGDDEAFQRALHTKTVEILGPEIAKLRAFFLFQKRAIERFGEEVRTLSNPKRQATFISQTQKVTLGKMIDMFAVLDSLKNMSPLNTDYAMYSRAQNFLNKGKTVDHEELIEQMAERSFLAEPKSITNQLQAVLADIPGCDEVLAEVVNECVQLYDAGMHVLPSEKHMLLKVISFSLYLIDICDPSGKINIYKHKRLQISKVAELFRALPIVPLFGDMHLALMGNLRMSPHYDEKKWSIPETESGDRTTFLTQVTARFDAEQTRFAAQLGLLGGHTVGGARTNMSGVSPSELALQGLQLISKWTATVQELVAFKLAHPTDQYTNKECPAEAEIYERATRYNYNAVEKQCLTRIIAMIKSTVKLMWDVEGLLTSVIRQDVHRKTQVFIQETLRDVIRWVTKKKKQRPRTVLMAIRDTCADWSKGTEDKKDPFLSGTKDLSYQPMQVRDRECSLGSTQLFMFRTMLESLCADDKKKSVKSEIDSKFYGPMNDFYRASFYFSHLLHFNETLHEVSDLSQLWFRELHLGMTRGAFIQFPIDMSLPWMLIDHTLESRDASIMEYALYPFDLYNDSANFSLASFKKQYLYDEVEAEVDLCFDQFIYKLSDKIFAHYKVLASSIMLDKEFDNTVARNKVKMRKASPKRYDILLRQRHFQLLGRTVDVNRLVSQRVNASLKKALKLAVEKFESGDLTHLLELESLLDQNKLTHALLSEHLTLDSYEEMFAEANDSVTSQYGRITLHVFAELCCDILPNFTYSSATRRFIRPAHAPIFGDGEPERGRAPRSFDAEFRYGSKVMNAAFGHINSVKRRYFGGEHFASIMRLLGYGGLAMCVDEMLKIVKNALSATLTPYLHALQDGMPKSCKLPLFDYGSQGVLGFYQLQLQDFMSYRDLQTEVLHAFREIGNAVIILHLLEENTMSEEIQDLSEAMPFQGIIPVDVREGDDVREKRAHAAKAHEYMFYKHILKVAGRPDQQQQADQGDVLTRERLCRGLSMFDAVLSRIRGMLVECSKEDTVWGGPPPANGILDIDECNRFHRFWSAIQYTASVTGALGKTDSIREYFGDGLQWAGCTLVALLDQRHTFESFDFSSHVLNAYRMDGKDEKVQGVSVKAFCANAQQKRELNAYVFAILEKHMQSMKKPHPVYYSPPSYNDEESVV